MKQETFQPNFPPLFRGVRPVWGVGNNLCSLMEIASIPTFTFYEEGSKDRAEKEKAYWEEKDKEYNEIKKVYEQNCFVGTTFCGNTDASARITKIVITDEKAYVCYKPSHEHVAKIEKENKKNKTNYKPIKGGKFGLNGFLSAIKNGTIRIIEIPDAEKVFKN